jgi:hypothetical protein
MKYPPQTRKLTNDYILDQWGHTETTRQPRFTETHRLRLRVRLYVAADDDRLARVYIGSSGNQHETRCVWSLHIGNRG